MKMNSKVLADTALNQVDNVGYYLSVYGVTDKVTRHTLMAGVFETMQRYNGQKESLQVRVNTTRVRVEQGVESLKQLNLTKPEGIQNLTSLVSKQVDQAGKSAESLAGKYIPAAKPLVSKLNQLRARII
ncbi:hypothetical protein GCM10022277_25230 [Litoribacillus peritrichatus]|uniref:Uncharacterized protein n=2 Tax=Litoribacillus peritrichatus TaxID=718191 RepID=A0ABP7MQ32_9GAMM